MVSIQKGGVGKSTTTTILAEMFAVSGFKVLVLDLDSQGNTTQMLTQKSIYANTGKTILEAIKESDPKKYLLHPKENIDLLPADDMLVSFSRYIYKERVRNPINTLGNAIREIESDYDIILMDCPPNLGDIVLNAIVYSDYIIIPVKPEAFGKDAVERFIDNIEDAKRAGHTTADILGILFTMRDTRIRLEKTVGNDIRKIYGNLVFDTEIRLRAKLEEYALTGVRMDKKADIEALEDYISLAEEVIKRIKELKNNG
jgi:chromosome partitioning protein